MLDPKRDGASRAATLRAMTFGDKRIGLGVLAFAMALVFFGLRAAPGVTFEDAGELVAAAASWGVPHPPGYPLLTLLGGLLARVLAPFGVGAAQAMVWLSVVSAAVAVGCVVRFVAGARGERPIAGLLAGGLLCLAPTFAAQAVVVEAYALSAALAAALLLAADRGHVRSAALLFGLGLSAHPAGVLFFPLFLFALLRAGKLRATWPRATVGVVLGLLPYAYVPLAAARGPALNWGGVHDLSSLFDHLLRRQFGVTPVRDIAAQGTFLSEHLFGQWPLIVLVALIGGLLAKGAQAAPDKDQAQPDRHAIPPTFYRVPLVFSTLLVTTVGLFWAQHWPVGEEITRVRLAGSFAPAVLWMAALVGLGLARLEGRLQARAPRSYRLPMLLVGLFLASFHLAPDYTNFGETAPTYQPGRATLAAFQDMSDVVEAEHYARFVLDRLPPESIVIVNRLGYSDVLTFPLLWGQIAQGLAPNVLVINREMLGLEWYRLQLAARRAELAPALDQLAAQLAAAPAGDPRAARLANVPFLRAVVARFPGEVAFIGRPSPRIAQDLQLTATDVAWWLTPAGAAAPTNAEPAWPFLDRASYPDPWRAELKAMARARDAFRTAE